MNLIIVESPTKANTIKNFLGQEYSVLSSYGHVRDLPKDELGVNIKDNFKPRYVVPQKSRKVISALKNEAEKAKSTILATDEDREGEAIAWHLSKVLNLENPQRIVFHEITKSAIDEALKKPREIDIKLVDSQQARRILDRLVGYKLSPFLWKKVARGLSAGRVQSVAVRLVVEREKEIENFITQEYWTVIATLKKQKAKKKEQKFEALLIKKNNKVIPKLGIKTKKEANKIIKDLKDAKYNVEKIEKKEIKRNPLPPFTTSTLQQEAWKRFRFPAKLTMRLAQQLYEKGHITYHRTDSLNLSNLSLSAAKKFISDNYGKEYWPGFFRKYKTKGRAQEAHEAIRPTFPNKTPEIIKTDKNQQKIYDLIWRRFIACQMSQAIFDSTVIDIKTEKYTFRTTGQMLKFDGFLKIYPMRFEENELPSMKKNETLELIELMSSQHFTQPPSRYTEATLIKTLEENGIGRPSTYAPILSTIQDRNYIEKDIQKKFYPTEIGIAVNNLLTEHFPKIVDIKFTAEMEKDLDEIAEGREKWINVCQEFYDPFEKNLQKKYQEVSKKTEKTEKKCPKCGADLVIRLGKFGKFYACSTFPKCKYTESLEKKSLGIKCPKCLASRDPAQRDKIGEIIEKKTRKGKIFYACNQFPKCDFALWDKPRTIVVRGKPTAEKCPKCDSLLIETKKKQIRCSNKDCDFEKR